MNRREFGNAGERAACEYLKRSGMKILEQNFRRPTGEIDVIARDGKTVVFVEVKRRSSLRYGRPSEAVDARKQAHILRTAMLYLSENQLEDISVRFDVVEILPDEISHIRNAFDMSGAF